MIGGFHIGPGQVAVTVFTVVVSFLFAVGCTLRLDATG
jgi:hypothetical protein